MGRIERNDIDVAGNEAPEVEKLSWRNPIGIGVLYVREFQSGERWLWTSIAGKRKATRLRWPDKASDRRQARSQGMKLLQKRVEEHLYPTSAPEMKQAPVAMAAMAATEAFEEERFPEMSRDIQTRYRMVWSHYLFDKNHGDFTLSYDSLYERIVEKRALCNLAPATKRKVWYKLKEFCDYCRRRKWISANPVDDMDKVKQPIPKVVRIFTKKEIADMVKWLRKEKREDHALLVELLALSGLRISEALKLRWEDFNDDHFLVWGKAKPGHVVEEVRNDAVTPRNGTTRNIPLRLSDGSEAIPGLLHVIARLRKRQTRRHNGYVFPFRSPNAVQHVIKDCRRECKLDDGRTIHTLRKSAKHLWREELGWSVELSAIVAGHSVAVAVKHYEQERSAREVIAAVEREGAKKLTPKKPKSKK